MMSLQAFRVRALKNVSRSITLTPSTQTNKLYFCGPEVGTHNHLCPQHYFAGASAERGSNIIANSVTKGTASSTTITKDPAASATVDMTSSVTYDIKRLNTELKKPTMTVWAEFDRSKVENGVTGAVRMENGD
jgi:hypothetical protein